MNFFTSPLSFYPPFFSGSEPQQKRKLKKKKLKQQQSLSLPFFVYSLYLYLEVTRSFSPLN